MNDKEVIRWLWDHGYFWDPANTVVDSFSAVANLDLHDPDLITCDALESFQIHNFSTINRFTEQLYGEAHRVTGRCGDATRRAMDVPRFCPLPDFPPPPGVEYMFADIDLQKAAQRMQAAGTGSWPPPCQREGVTFSVDERGMPAKMRERWAAIKLDVVRDYARLGVKLIEVAYGQPANIRISWENLNRIGQGVIGLAEFNAETCSDSVFCKMHPDYYPDDDQIRQLLQHEIGHNMNLPHTPNGGGIMNPSITDGWVGFVDSDPSVPRLRRFFPGGPIDVPTDPLPGPTGVALLGTTSVEVDGKIVGEFSFRPKTNL